MEKVKVTKEVAEAIETLRRNNIINYSIARAFTGDATFYNEENADAIDVLGYHFRKVDDLYRVLLNGYEVEKTPEEEIAELYLDCHKTMTNSVAHKDYDKALGISTGITFTLDALGIHIEGVNA